MVEQSKNKNVSHRYEDKYLLVEQMTGLWVKKQCIAKKVIARAAAPRMMKMSAPSAPPPRSTSMSSPTAALPPPSQPQATIPTSSSSSTAVHVVVNPPSRLPNPVQPAINPARTPSSSSEQQQFL